MDERILRNAHAAQYIYAARKNFVLADRLSESSSRAVIGHFTDIHSDIPRFDNCMCYFDHFAVDLAIHTGDTVKWDMRDNYDFFRKGARKAKTPVYNCIGNHETKERDRKPTNSELYDKLLAHQAGMVAPCDRGYYYTDLGDKGLRLIVLNCYDADMHADRRRECYTLGQHQCLWLIDTLKDAQAQSYGVIIAAHESDISIPAADNDLGFCQRFAPNPWGQAIPHEHIVADIVHAFIHGGELDIDMTWQSTGVRVSLHDSFSGGGEFICHLSGHRHGDYTGYLPGYPDQLSVCMTCSGCYPEGYHNIGEEVSDLPRIPGTQTEDAVNIYVIDRTFRTVTIVRVGASLNDRFEPRLCLTLPYALDA